MAIPSRQIGWGTEENLLWEISKQLEYLNGVAYRAASIQVPSNNIVVANVPNNQAITSGSDSLVNFTTVIDPNGWFVDDGSSFQPTIAGYYNISYSVLWSTGTGTGQLNTQIHKNSGTQLFIAQNQINTTQPLTQSGSVIVYLNGTTDYVYITAYTSSANGSQTIQNATGTKFNASLI